MRSRTVRGFRRLEVRTGARLGLEQSGVSIGGQKVKRRLRPFAFGCRNASRHVVRRIRIDKGLHDKVVFDGDPEANREIRFPNRLLSELRVHGLGGWRVFGENDDATGVHIQTMDAIGLRAKIAINTTE